MYPVIKKTYAQFIFFFLKLPLIYITLAVGFVFEYLVSFPYIILCTMDSISIRKKNRKRVNASGISSTGA
ncbi:MAG: hypothetical protein C4518_02195 [Desulfobacteraceae bacterium]|nr:MAG: hypothetical protein C4518_02195 [Desulfobacteraceae bacterium]